MKKLIVTCLLFFQLFSPILFCLTSVAEAAEKADITKNNKHNATSLPTLSSGDKVNEEINRSKLASSASQLGTILSKDHPGEATINYAKGVVRELVNDKINHWLNQYGVSKIAIESKHHIAGDLLLPVVDSSDHLLFTQLGLRTNQNRNTVNVGAGYRQRWQRWLYGANTFYDHDYTGHNTRLGIGIEALTDHFRLTLNRYYRLTHWHQSKLKIMRDFDERPANEFDIRAEAYLPAYPQVGVNIKYEKYFGQGVQLATRGSSDQLKDDPQLITVGLNYTPVPLLILKGDRIIGDHDETKLGLDIIYRFGVPFVQQLNPHAVPMIRTIDSNRYNFVDRNYDITLQYRKQELLKITLPHKLEGLAGDTIPISVEVNKQKYGLDKIIWTSSFGFVEDRGEITSVSPTEFTIQLPSYRNNAGLAAQKYFISAVAIDKQGNQSNKATMVIWVSCCKYEFYIYPKDVTVKVGGYKDFDVFAEDVDGNIIVLSKIVNWLASPASDLGKVYVSPRNGVRVYANKPSNEYYIYAKGKYSNQKFDLSERIRFVN